MKKFLTFLIVVFIVKISQSQNPSKCFELESILVDACNFTSLEPNNEMFVFKTGPGAINIANLTLSGQGGSGTYVANAWPTTTIPWLGLVQNASTATVTAALQATISNGCGQLIEPPGGIIPPNSSVLVVASSNPSATDNSFAALTDTLYIVYHNATYTVTTGHFKNSPGVGMALSATSYTAANPTRGIILKDISSGCSDTAVFDITLLTNTVSATPYGGSTAQNDGATVEFAWPGSPTANYINQGCKAPFIPLSASAAPTSTTICNNASASLTGTAGGTYTATTWSGGTGTFGNVNALNTTYTPGAGENGLVILTLTVYGKCMGATATATVAVTVNAPPTPVVSSSGGNTLCSGTSTTLSVTSTGTLTTTYTWNPGNVTGSSLSVTPPVGSNVYTVNAVNSCGSANATFTIDVNALPVVSVASTSVCPGFTATITASGASTYTWNTTAVGSTLSDAPSGTTQYTVTGTDANSCTNTAVGTITVYNSPTITVNNASTCIGGTVTLTASGVSTFTWSTTDNTSSISVSPSGPTNYTVSGTDANGCVASAVASVTVFPKPIISVPSQTICPGNTATLTATGASTYTWNTTASGATITDNPSSNTSYTVVGTDANGCMGTTTASVTVVNSLTISAVATNTVICTGSSTTLTASGGGTYSWSPAGTLSASSGSSVTASPVANATYTVIGISGSCSDTATVTVNVNPLPSVGATATSTLICPGGTVTLTGTGAQTYSWSAGVTDGVAFNPSASQTYTVIGTDINGCTNTATISVVVNTFSINPVSSATAICAGSPNAATLTVTGAMSYSWSPAGSLSVSTGSIVVASPTVTTTYTVVGTALGCSATNTVSVLVNNPPTIAANATQSVVCAGTSITLTGSGGLIYAWTGGVSNGVPFTPTTTATYSVIGVDMNGCQGLAAVTVTVNPLPTVNVNSATVCAGNSATLTASGASTYTWSTTQQGNSISVNPVSQTVYTVNATDLNGCSGSQTATVSVNSLPNVTANSPGVCSGNTATLTASGAANYTWSTGQTTTSITVPASNLSYTVTGVDANGCTGSFVATVTVSPTPTITTTNVSTCPGVPAVVTAGGASTYTWSSGGTGSTISVSPTGTTIYTVNGTNTAGCSASQTVMVTVNTPPSASFTPSSLTGQVPASVSFSNTSTGNGLLLNFWDFGNGAVSVLANPSETYTVSGVYTVTLTVMDVNGCSDTASISLTIIDLPVVIPNVFSPNGDNINDIFTITAFGATNFNCKIYDRWGLLLYEWNDVKGGWDGKITSNGKDATDGTYFFILSYSDNNKKPVNKQGYVQLIR